MKRLLSLLIICFPIFALAQKDAKYMENAVPVVDGKVTFTKELNTASLNKEQVYQTLLKWANNRFKPDSKFNARLLYSNEQEGNIAIAGEEYLVFSSSALSLDRTRIYYQIHLNCLAEKSTVTMTRIRYWYNESRKGGEKFAAEEWITDEIAMNKNKTKLYPSTGKFRKKTIDLKDNLFKEAQACLDSTILALGSTTSPQSEQKVQKVQAIVPNLEDNVTPQKEIDPETLISQAFRMTITAGNDEQMEISKDSWGGFGELFGKKVVFCLVDSQKTIINLLMSQNDTYHISLYQTNDNQPSLVVKCKKITTQNMDGEEAKKMNSHLKSEKKYNLYIGEFIK